MRKFALILLFSLVINYGLKAQDVFEKDVQLLTEYIYQGDTLSIKAFYPKYEQLYRDAIAGGDEETITQYAFVFAIICEACHDFQQDYEVASKGLALAKKLYPKQYDLLAYFYQRLSISSMGDNKLKDAIKYANEALSVSKKNKENPSTYIINLSLCSQINTELGSLQIAYKQIKEAYASVGLLNDADKKTICDRYLSVLRFLAVEAADKGQVNKIEGYYNEAQNILDSNSNIVSAYILDDEFFNKIIKIKIQEGDLKSAIAVANARVAADRKGYERFVSKGEEDYISPSDYTIAMPLTYASDAYGKNDLDAYYCYVETAYHNSQNPEVSLEYQSYAIGWYASYAAYEKNYFKEAFDAFWNKFKIDEKRDADLATLKQDLSDIILLSYVTTNYLRYFYKAPQGSVRTSNFIPVLLKSDSDYILTEWGKICSYIEENYTASLYREVAESVINLTQEYRVFPMLSKEDIELMKGHHAVYYRNYALFDGIIPRLIDKNRLNDDRIIDLIWRIDNNLFLNYDFSSAQDFLTHIKELDIVKNRPKVIEWVENESPYLADWVNQEVIRAQGLTAEGRVEEAKRVYDTILSQVEKTEGESANYAYAMCYKGIDLYSVNNLQEAKELLEEASNLSYSVSPDNYDIRYASLKGLIATCSALEDYESITLLVGYAEAFLKSHPKGNDNYNYYDERCYVFWKKAEASWHAGNSTESERIIHEGLSFVDSNISACDSMSRVNLYSELIEEYCDNAEVARKKGDSKTCLGQFKKSLSVIDKNPDLLNEFLYIIGKTDVFISSLKAMTSDGSNSVIRFNDYYLRLIDKVYNASLKSGKQSQAYNEWKFDMVYNLASNYWHADIATPAIDLFDESIRLLCTLPETPQFGSDDVTIIDYQSIIASELMNDYPQSIRYKTKGVLRAIEEYGQLDSLTFSTFDQAYIAYKVSIAASTNFALGEMDFAYNPRLSYDENLDIIHTWRDAQDSISKKYGQAYVDSLYRYSLIKANNYSISSGGANLEHSLEHLLPPNALTYRRELFLNIYFNRVAEIGRCSEGLFNSLKENGWNVTDDLFCDVVCEVAEEIEKRGYLEHAVSFLLNYYTVVLESDALELKEKVESRIGFLAWRSGNNDLLAATIIPAGLLASKYSGYEQYKSFQSVDELLSQLVLASRFYKPSDIEQADEYLSIAERLINEDTSCQNNKKPSLSAKVLFYEELASNAKDLETAERAYLAIKQLDTTWIFADALNLASIYASGGKYEQSKELLNQVLDYMKKNYVQPRWKLQAMDCQIENALHDGDIKLAQSVLREELGVVEKDFFSTTSRLSDLSRTNYWDKYYSFTLETFTTNDLRINSNMADISYDAAIFHKGILKRMRNIVRNNIRNSEDDLLKQLYAEYTHAQITGSDSLAQKERAFMYQYSLHPEFTEIVSLHSWKDVQNSLKKGEIAIEYTLSLDTEINDFVLSAIILKKDQKAPKIIRLTPESELKGLLSKTRQSNGYSIAYDIFEGNTNELYNRLWEPIEQELKGIKTVYFSPYAEINAISLEALRKDEKSKCLFERYNMVRLSSTEEICNHNNGFVTTAAVFGDIDYNYTTGHTRNMQLALNDNDESESELTQQGYSQLRALRGEWDHLSGTKDEVNSISSLLSSNNIKVEVFTQADGSEEVFKSLSSKNVSLIHLATHGFYFNNTDAMRINYFNREQSSSYISSGLRSGIIFSGANNAWKGADVPNGEEDGVLTADEILGMELDSTDLLILSACQSALGDSGSDGVYGIQRSFKIAGVNSIIMSLWEVDDEATSLMMQAFYQNYVKGMRKRDAFKAAQLEVRKTFEERAKTQSTSIPKYKRYDSSYYWASFILLD